MPEPCDSSVLPLASLAQSAVVFPLNCREPCDSSVLLLASLAHCSYLVDVSNELQCLVGREGAL